MLWTEQGSGGADTPCSHVDRVGSRSHPARQGSGCGAWGQARPDMRAAAGLRLRVDRTSIKLFLKRARCCLF